MKKILCIITVFLGLISLNTSAQSFLQAQLKYAKVRDAQQAKSKVIEDLLTSKGIKPTNVELFIRIFKKEQQLEVWGKNKGDARFVLLQTYAVCANSGTLGPKRKSGDRQMPEGFYTVDLFNPQSQYHLSMRVSYPNASDLKFADPINPGDNIFIHGSCLTIGCFPIGDESMKELYLLAVRAKSNGKDIPVHIFPTKLNDSNYKTLQESYATNSELLKFWSWLKPGYDIFETKHQLPTVTITAAGEYMAF